jgi:hypothetical protein
MDEFNFDNNFDIGTPISKLKNKKKSQNDDILFLIKDLENRLDKIESSNILQINKNNIISYKDIIIYIISFILLNNDYIIKIIYKIPHVNSINSPYPNLIIRTFIFGIIIYLYKIFYKR